MATCQTQCDRELVLTCRASRYQLSTRKTAFSFVSSSQPESLNSIGKDWGMPPYAVWTNGLVPRGAGGLIRLFCLPPAGGGASAYWSWIAKLRPEIEIWALQLPGRESRWGEPAQSHMASLVSSLVKDLESLFVPPFAFFGHSMGALIAFELTHELQRRGKPGPMRLLVSAARAPQIPDPEEPLHARSDEEILSALRRLDGIPKQLFEHAEVLQLLLPTIRADLQLCETYEFCERAPLECPISVFGGDQDVKVPRVFLEPWRYHTTQGFRLRTFPGGHFYLTSASTELLDAVLQDLTVHEGETE